MIYLIVGLICLVLCLLVLTFAPEHRGGAFIAFLMCIAVLMIGVNVNPQGKILLTSTSKELDTMADQLTEETESSEKEDKETRKSQERRLKELADSGEATIFIDVHNETYQIYNGSVFGEMRKLTYAGWQQFLSFSY